MAELNITEVNGNLTVSGGGSFTENVTAPNINDLINNLKEKALSGSSSGITEYPSKAGIYRVTGANIGFPFSTYNYGTLIIFFSGYVTHIFVDSTSQKIWYAIGADSVKCPSDWKELTALKYKDITDTTSSTGAISIADVSSTYVINAVIISHTDYYAQIYTGWSGTKYGVVIKHYNNNQVLANTQVTIRYYYY